MKNRTRRRATNRYSPRKKSSKNDSLLLFAGAALGIGALAYFFWPKSKQSTAATTPTSSDTDKLPFANGGQGSQGIVLLRPTNLSATGSCIGLPGFYGN